MFFQSFILEIYFFFSQEILAIMNFISIREEAVYNTHVVNIYLSELSRG